MSQENVELVYRVLDAVNRRDLDDYLALLDDDVEYVPRGAAMEGSYHGHDGIRRWWESVFGVWPDLTNAGCRSARPWRLDARSPACSRPRRG